MYWACAQVETRRERVASHFLGLAGYEIYCPYVREARRNHGRRVMRVSPLFPSYLFVAIVSGFWSARWSPGVIRLVMDGERPAIVGDNIIAEIRGRERNGFVELPKSRSGLIPGAKVRVVEGPLASQIGMLVLLKPRERVLVLLSLLGGERRVDLAKSAVELVQQT